MTLHHSWSRRPWCSCSCSCRPRWGSQSWCWRYVRFRFHRASAFLLLSFSSNSNQELGTEEDIIISWRRSINKTKLCPVVTSTWCWRLGFIELLITLVFYFFHLRYKDELHDALEVRSDFDASVTRDHFLQVFLGCSESIDVSEELDTCKDGGQSTTSWGSCCCCCQWDRCWSPWRGRESVPCTGETTRRGSGPWLGQSWSLPCSGTALWRACCSIWQSAGSAG